MAGGRFEYSVISDIYSAGIPPAEAGALIAEKVVSILEHGAAGNRLERTVAERGR